MKNLNKTLLAAALMVAAGSANAAFTNGSTTGQNEAFLVAYDAGYLNTDGTNGRTFNYDLGVTFSALVANATSALSAFEGAGKSLASDANWATFTGAGSTSLVTYGVFAVGDTSTQANNGVFVTSGQAPVAPLVTNGTSPAGSTTTWGGAVTAVNQQASSIASGTATTSSVISQTDAALTGQANGYNPFNVGWNFGNGVTPAAAWGTDNNFYEGVTHLGTVTTVKGPKTTVTPGVALLAQSDINLIGAFNLGTNGLLHYTPAAVSAVPLPAAVWMFGAGLMGVLRLNRRKSAQA